MSFITALYASRHILVASYLTLVLASARRSRGRPQRLMKIAAALPWQWRLTLYASSRAEPLEMKSDASNCWLNWSGW